ncbi:hypothetical protein BH11ACT4_BH11ACT4_21320 [soil metagenome]
MGMPNSGRAFTAAVVGTLAIAALAGCTPGKPTPVPTYTPSASASGTPAPEAAPVLRPGDTAEANKEFFDAVNTAFYAAHGKADGKSIIDNLVAAGFRKQDMEVTPDTTSIGDAVDSIVFSVRVKGKCLVGQFNGAAYHGIVGPILANGGCLVGTTRPIDW